MFVVFSTTTNCAFEAIVGASSSTSLTLIVTVCDELLPAWSLAVTTTTAVV